LQLSVAAKVGYKGWMLHRLCVCVLGVLAFAALPVVAATNHHVILITMDGFPAYVFTNDQSPIPTLRKLAKDGAVAEGLKVSNPSVTWPNHTTLVTGVRPDQHSVLFNGVLVRPGPGLPVKVDGQRDKSDLVAVTTVFDVLHKAGYRTAGINWPCTRNSGTLHDDFPDVPQQITHSTPRLREELIAEGILKDATERSFSAQSAASKDQIWTAAAVHVIEKRRPNFMMFHMLVTDSTHHKYGALSPAGYNAIALVDGQLREVLRALDVAGIRDKTTIFIVADHGFEKALKVVNPNMLLRKAGLLEATSVGQIVRARAQIISEGGTALVYLTNPQTHKEDAAKVREILRDQEGIEEIIEPERFAELGYPDPERNPQMAQMVLAAKPGYAFSNSALGDEWITEVTLEQGNQGYHGYLASNPKMNAVFVAAGRGIKKGAQIGVIENIHVAPTIARLLGVELPGARGKVLGEILE
jgi:predicted AlkP superfamily pyrophosphatase or phosphodiesterase